MVSERKSRVENTINGCQIGKAAAVGEFTSRTDGDSIATEKISSTSKRSRKKRAFNVSRAVKGELQASVQNVRIVKSPRAGNGNVSNVVFLVTEMWLEASTCTPLLSIQR